MRRHVGDFLETLRGNFWHEVAHVILVGLSNGLRIIHPKLEPAWLPRLSEYLHLEQKQKSEHTTET